MEWTFTGSPQVWKIFAHFPAVPQTGQGKKALELNFIADSLLHKEELVNIFCLKIIWYVNESHLHQLGGVFTENLPSSSPREVQVWQVMKCILSLEHDWWAFQYQMECHQDPAVAAAQLGCASALYSQSWGRNCPVQGCSEELGDSRYSCILWILSFICRVKFSLIWWPVRCTPCMLLGINWTRRVAVQRDDPTIRLILTSGSMC